MNTKLNDKIKEILSDLATSSGEGGFTDEHAEWVWSQILAAAPVQAQEQCIDKLTYDAQVDEWAIEKGNLEREIEELKSRAPVHPVAVPDGPYTFPIGEDGEYMILDKDGQQVGTVLYYHAAKVIAAALAAPAAQGDAIEGELTKIVKSGAEKDLPGFLEWIADRLVYVHSENNNVDYVQTLRTRAKQLRAAIAAKAES